MLGLAVLVVRAVLAWLLLVLAVALITVALLRGRTVLLLLRWIGGVTAILVVALVIAILGLMWGLIRRVRRRVGALSIVSMRRLNAEE